jgi:hypothetical protein
MENPILFFNLKTNTMKVRKQKMGAKIWIIAFMVFGILSFQMTYAAEGDQNQTDATPEDLTRPKTVQVSPVRFDWNMEDGDERSAQINLKNYSDKPYSVEVQIEDFYVKDDSSVAEFFVPDATHPLRAFDVINWVSTSEKKLVLAPSESRNITFTTKVPVGTPTGGYYGVVFFQYEEDKANMTDAEKDAAAKIQINTRSGVLLTLAVKGAEDLYENGVLDKFKTLKFFHWDKPVTFLTQISNGGNMHYRMAGDIEIERFGKSVTTIKVDPRLYYPKKIRPLENIWNCGFFDIGYYTAKLNLVSEDGNVNIFGKTSFIVIPWRLVAVVVGIIFSLWLIFKMGGRKERKKIIRKTVK